MAALIVCASVHHGNTRQIARVMAQALDAHLCDPADVDPSEAAKYDLIGLGSGIYFWRHHASIVRFAQNMPVRGDQRFFIFSTRGGFPHWLGHRALKKTLRKKGAHVVGEFSCKGHDTYGPFKLLGGLNRGHPDADDLERARRFAEELP
ncbi:MAG: flavodoxin family protein [Candidatus Thermoplasmatota archaeon]|nr:flavodoxin family protein [Candidatus Thermoplasmatota archaeon]